MYIHMCVHMYNTYVHKHCMCVDENVNGMSRTAQMLSDSHSHAVGAAAWSRGSSVVEILRKEMMKPCVVLA